MGHPFIVAAAAAAATIATRLHRLSVSPFPPPPPSLPLSFPLWGSGARPIFWLESSKLRHRFRSIGGTNTGFFLLDRLVRYLPYFLSLYATKCWPSISNKSNSLTYLSTSWKVMGLPSDTTPSNVVGWIELLIKAVKCSRITFTFPLLPIKNVLPRTPQNPYHHTSRTR